MILHLSLHCPKRTVRKPSVAMGMQRKGQNGTGGNKTEGRWSDHCAFRELAIVRVGSGSN